MTAYPGRSFGQLYHRFAKGNALASGAVRAREHDVSLADVTAPVPVFAGATDGIAPVAAVRPVVDLLTGAREVRFEIVPGGHLGMLTGRAARGSTWQVLDEWIEQWSGAAVGKRAAGKGAPRKKAAAKKAAPRKRAAAKRTAAKKTAAKKPAASKDTIGSNPSRRYGSGGSRALSR
jgi:polyhydroxyalkanoate synthase